MRSGFVVRVVIRAFRGAEAGTWTTKRTKKNTKRARIANFSNRV